MAPGPITQVSDIVVPAIFTPYIQQLTEEKSRLVQSGALATSGLLASLLSGGGLTFNIPSFKDLDNDADNVSTDDVADIGNNPAFGGATHPTRNDAVPFKIGSATEIAVRLSRNGHWSSADLANALAGPDPLEAIANRVANWWMRRLQDVYIATWQGVSRDNGVNDSGDYANEIVGAGFVDGVTNFSAEAFLDTTLTMGDSLDNLAMVMVHSVVYNRMRKNNLIDFIPDARGEVNIPTFQGHEVIVDDRMPNGVNVIRADGTTTGSVAGMYETWIFGSGAGQLGRSSPKVPTEVSRQPLAGQGGGQEVLSSRLEWALHPVGHAYTGTSPNGGPGNGTGANNLNDAGSWDRVYSERKQISFARLISREA